VEVLQEFLFCCQVRCLKVKSTLYMLLLIIIILFCLYWGYCIYHVTTSRFNSKDLKFMWSYLILFFPVSSLFYFLVIRGKVLRWYLIKYIINMKKSIHYNCPNCLCQLPIRKIWFLSNNSKIQCKCCGKILSPQKIQKFDFLFGIITAIPGIVSLHINHSLIISMLIQLFFGLILFLIYVLQIYYFVKFRIVS
jgi:hypothetical protein